MSRFGPALVAAGMALLVVPLAELMGAVGYLLVGGCFLVAGSVVTIDPTLAGDGTDGPDRLNCPACGAPNDPGAAACEHCGRAFE